MMQAPDSARQIRLRTVQDYYDGYNAGAVQAVLACYAEEASHEDVASGQTRSGTAALQTGLERFFALFAGLRFEPGRIIVAGDSLLCDYRMTGTLTRDLGPLKLAGRPVTVTGAHLLDFAGARIARSRDYWDFEELAAQAAR